MPYTKFKDKLLSKKEKAKNLVKEAKFLMPSPSGAFDILINVARVLPTRLDTRLSAAVKLGAIAVTVAKSLSSKLDQGIASRFPQLDLIASTNQAFADLLFASSVKDQFDWYRLPYADRRRVLIGRSKISHEQYLLFIESMEHYSSTGYSKEIGYYYHSKNFDFDRHLKDIWTNFPNGVELRWGNREDPIILDQIPEGFEGLISTSGIRERVTILSLCQMDLENESTRTYLAYGPPGTGKTKALEWVAKKLGRSILKMEGSFLEDLSYSRLTSFLRCLKPECILIDDLDRGDIEQNSSKILRGIELLRSLNKSTLIFITANSPESFSDALLRSERIDEAFEFPHPTDQDRLEILDILGEKDKQYVFDKTANFNYADLVDIIKRTKIEGSAKRVIDTKVRLRELARKSKELGGGRPRIKNSSNDRRNKPPIEFPV